MEDYKLLLWFLRNAALSFGIFSENVGTELEALADKYEAGTATVEDKELTLKILNDAKKHFMSVPQNERRDVALVSVGLLIGQLELELRGWPDLKD